MIVLINGPFGVGKTTLARELRERIDGSVLYDPELLGYVLQRLPHPRAKQDFQDFTIWRRSVSVGAAVLLNFYATVIIPMAIWRPDYLAQITTELARMDDRLEMLCLTVEATVLRARIDSRTASEPARKWMLEKAEQLEGTFDGPKFGKHIDTTILTPQEVCIEALHALGL